MRNAEERLRRIRGQFYSLYVKGFLLFFLTGGTRIGDILSVFRDRDLAKTENEAVRAPRIDVRQVRKVSVNCAFYRSVAACVRHGVPRLAIAAPALMLERRKMKNSAILLSYFLIRGSVCVLLEGNVPSYAQFKKWNVALNGSLEFEFKTERPNGLLLYTDDGGTYDFFEIKLVEGALRLRYNLGGGAQIITIGRELNDGRWHKVSIKRNDDKTVLTVNNVTQSRTSKGKEFYFGNLATNSDVYVGGMPSWYNTKLTRLALPSVMFEPRFDGVIRNLVYTDSDSDGPKRQRIKRSSRRVSCTASF